MTLQKKLDCPLNRGGLMGDFDSDNRGCFATGRPDADMDGYGYDQCDFSGNCFQDCKRYREFFKNLGYKRS